MKILNQVDASGLTGGTFEPIPTMIIDTHEVNVDTTGYYDSYEGFAGEDLV